MENRPKLKVPLSIGDKVIESLSWLALIGLWALVIFNYQQLPDEIPIHFNAVGEADGYGGKGSILALPIIATVLFAGLSVLNQYPHVFNYPTSLSEDNALRQYTIATRLIRFLKLALVVIFGLIVYKTIHSLQGNKEGLGFWFLPTALAMIFIPLVYYISLSIRKK
jgi:uncharacterized membrane protein